VITADTITDEQIRELRQTPAATCIGHRDACDCMTCVNARWDHNAIVQLADRAAYEPFARARCAEILNARADGK
jgi:hypothetical protein